VIYEPTSQIGGGLAGMVLVASSLTGKSQHQRGVVSGTVLVPWRGTFNRVERVSGVTLVGLRAGNP